MQAQLFILPPMAKTGTLVFSAIKTVPMVSGLSTMCVNGLVSLAMMMDASHLLLLVSYMLGLFLLSDITV